MSPPESPLSSEAGWGRALIATLLTLAACSGGTSGMTSIGSTATTVTIEAGNFASTDSLIVYWNWQGNSGDSSKIGPNIGWAPCIRFVPPAGGWAQLHALQRRADGTIDGAIYEVPFTADTAAGWTVQVNATGLHASYGPQATC